MNQTLALFRPAVLEMKAYSSARSLATTGSIFLDANELPWGPLNRYPQPQPKKLIEMAANYYDQPRENILATRGSDEGIEVLVRAFCEAGRDLILICPPTYGVYGVAAQIQGAGILKVPLLEDASTLDEEGIIKSAPKLIFLCAPNNPTGVSVPREQILRICQATLGRSVVVVDEAYAEFSEGASVVKDIPANPNLVVLRTLSKAWGLASARCGFLLARPEIVEELQKVRAPYPLSGPAVEAVLQSFNEQGVGKMRESVAKVIVARENLRRELSRISLIESVFASSTNFLLVRIRDGRVSQQSFHEIAFHGARERGIILRDRSGEPGLERCLRITVGTPEENQQVLDVFKTAAVFVAPTLEMSV